MGLIGTCSLWTLGCPYNWGDSEYLGVSWSQSLSMMCLSPCGWTSGSLLPSSQLAGLGLFWGHGTCHLPGVLSFSWCSPALVCRENGDTLILPQFLDDTLLLKGEVGLRRFGLLQGSTDCQSEGICSCMVKSPCGCFVAAMISLWGIYLGATAKDGPRARMLSSCWERVYLLRLKTSLLGSSAGWPLTLGTWVAQTCRSVSSWNDELRMLLLCRNHLAVSIPPSWVTARGWTQGPNWQRPTRPKRLVLLNLYATSCAQKSVLLFLHIVMSLYYIIK